jgi:hypothetical protein
MYASVSIAITVVAKEIFPTCNTASFFSVRLIIYLVSVTTKIYGQWTINHETPGTITGLPSIDLGTGL